MLLCEIFIPIATALIFLFGFDIRRQHAEKLPFERFIPKKLNKKGRAAFLALVPSVLLSVLLVIIHFLVTNFTITDKEMSVTAVAVVSILMQLAIAFGICGSERFKKLFSRITAFAFTFLIAETFVFNLKSFTSEPQSQVIDLKSCILEGDREETPLNTIVIKNNFSIVSENVPQYTHAIILDIAQEQKVSSKLFTVKALYRDDNITTGYQLAQIKMTKAFERKTDFTINTYGKIRAVKIDISDISEPVTIKTLTFASALPFRFSSLRFFFLLAVCSLIVLIKQFRLYEITYDPTKRKHKLAVQLMAGLCTMSAVFFYTPKEISIQYDKANPPQDHYSLQTDAILKGHAWLEKDVPENLDSLEFMYSRTEREANGIEYAWDFAYKDGHYYSYFGGTPVLTAYLPFYLITGNMPERWFVISIFGTLAIYFMCQLILSSVKLTVKKPNLLLLLLLLPASVVSSGIFFLINYSSTYYVPIVSALCWLSICLWSGIEGYCSTKMGKRNILFIISGLSLGLCAGSRPGMCLCALILTPLYLGILLNKDSKLSSRIFNAVSFLTPAVIGVLAVLWFNYFRFGSFFDFGAEYQLTVSDVNANSLRLSSIPAAIYHYFLQPIRALDIFPYFETSFSVLHNYTSYLYVSYNFAALSFPIIFLGILLMPFSLAKKNENTEKTSSRCINAFTILCLVFSFIVSWENLCMGGADTRYVCDMLIILVVASVTVLLRFNSKIEKTRYIITGVTAVITVVMMTLIHSAVKDGILLITLPNLYDDLENLLIFWQ